MSEFDSTSNQSFKTASLFAAYPTVSSRLGSIVSSAFLCGGVGGILNAGMVHEAERLGFVASKNTQILTQLGSALSIAAGVGIGWHEANRLEAKFQTMIRSI